MSIQLKSFSYSNTSVPEGYCCSECGKSGVRLYREYQTFMGNQVLRCELCAKQNQGERSSGKHAIGWLVAAVPTEDGETFWGYTSVPLAGISWWESLSFV